MEENSENNKIKISASECLSWEYAEWKIWPCFFNTAYKEKDVCNESLTSEKKLQFMPSFGHSANKSCFHSSKLFAKSSMF